MRKPKNLKQFEDEVRLLLAGATGSDPLEPGVTATDIGLSVPEMVRWLDAVKCTYFCDAGNETEIGKTTFGLHVMEHCETPAKLAAHLWPALKLVQEEGEKGKAKS